MFPLNTPWNFWIISIKWENWEKRVKMKSFDTVNGENFQSSYENNVKKWFAPNLLALFHFLELMHGLNFDLQRQKKNGYK